MIEEKINTLGEPSGINITIDNLTAAEKILEKVNSWTFNRNVLTNYFQSNTNNDKSTMLIKIILVDSLYNTNLSKTMSAIELVEQLFKKNQESKLDEYIQQGNLEAIEIITDIAPKNILSFASKFCHFHNKNAFPIYDSYACIALKKLFGYKDKRKYSEFANHINKIKQKFGTNDLERIDTFLWLYGLKLELDKDKKNINKEVTELYLKNPELFKNLEPTTP